MAALRTMLSPALLRQGARISPLIQRAMQIHTTRPNRIGPAGPQVIKGTVNDPVTFPEPNKAHGSYHWAFERGVSVALIPLTIAPFAVGSLNPVTDALLVSALVIHSHIGFDACITDYVPTRKYGTFVSSGFKWLLRLATGTVLVGFYEFETNDVGLTEGIKRIWTA